jgi:hypothetical protein
MSKTKQEIDLSGSDGNAFALLGYAETFAEQLGYDGPAIQEDMMSGDYKHLLDIFEKHFGDFIYLNRNGCEE